MIKSYLISYLKPLLSTFLEDESLSTELFKFESDGSLSLNNVSINPALLSSLELPVTITRACVSSLKIHVGLGSVFFGNTAGILQLRLEIKGLFVLATLSNTVPGENRIAVDLNELDAAISSLMEQSGATNNLNKSESSDDMRNLSASESKRTVGKGGMSKLIKAVSEGVTLDISDVHIRLESGNKRNLSVGLVLDSISVKSIESPTALGATDPGSNSLSFVRKQLGVTGLALYCNCGSEMQLSSGGAFTAAEFSEVMQSLMRTAAHDASTSATSSSTVSKSVSSILSRSSSSSSSSSVTSADHNDNRNTQLESVNISPQTMIIAKKKAGSERHQYVLFPLDISAKLVVNDTGYPPAAELHHLLRTGSELNGWEEELSYLLPDDMPFLPPTGGSTRLGSPSGTSPTLERLKKQWFFFKRDAVAFLSEIYADGGGGARSLESIKRAYGEGHERSRLDRGTASSTNSGQYYDPSSQALVPYDDGAVVDWFRLARLDSPSLIALARRFEAAALLARPPAIDVNVEITSLHLSLSDKQLRDVSDLVIALGKPPQVAPLSYDINLVAAKLGMYSLLPESVCTAEERNNMSSSIAYEISTLLSQSVLATSSKSAPLQPTSTIAAQPLLLSVSELEQVFDEGRSLFLESLLDHYTTLEVFKLHRSKAGKSSQKLKSDLVSEQVIAGLPIASALEKWLIESYAQGLDSVSSARTILTGEEDESGLSMLSALAIARGEAERRFLDETTQKAAEEASTPTLFSRFSTLLRFSDSSSASAIVSPERTTTAISAADAPRNLLSNHHHHRSKRSEFWTELLNDIVTEDGGENEDTNETLSNDDKQEVDPQNDSGFVVSPPLSVAFDEHQNDPNVLSPAALVSMLKSSQDSTRSKPGEPAFALHSLLRPYYRPDGRCDYAGGLFEYFSQTHITLAIRRGGLTLSRSTRERERVTADATTSQHSKKVRLRAGLITLARTGVAYELSHKTMPILRLSLARVAADVTLYSQSLLAVNIEARRAALLLRKQHLAAVLFRENSRSQTTEQHGVSDANININNSSSTSLGPSPPANGRIEAEANNIEAEVLAFEKLNGNVSNFEPPLKLSVAFSLGDIEIIDFVSKQSHPYHILRRHIPAVSYLSSRSHFSEVLGNFVSTGIESYDNSRELLPPLIRLDIDLGKNGVDVAASGEIQRIDVKLSLRIVPAILDFLRDGLVSSNSNEVIKTSPLLAGASSFANKARTAAVSQVAQALQRSRHAIDDPRALYVNLVLKSMRIIIPRCPSAPECDVLVVSTGDIDVRSDSNNDEGANSSSFREESSTDTYKRCFDLISIRNSGLSAAFLHTSPTGRVFAEEHSQFHGEATVFLLPITLTATVGLAKTNLLRQLTKTRIHTHVGDIHVALSSLKLAHALAFVNDAIKQISPPDDSDTTSTSAIDAEIPEPISSSSSSSSADTGAVPPPTHAVPPPPPSISASATSMPLSSISPRSQELSFRGTVDSIRVTLASSSNTPSSFTWRGQNYTKILGKCCVPLLSLAIDGTYICADTNSDGAEVRLEVNDLHSWDLLRVSKSGWSEYEQFLLANTVVDQNDPSPPPPPPLHPLSTCHLFVANKASRVLQSGAISKKTFLTATILSYPASTHLSPANTAIDVSMGHLSLVLNRDSIARVIDTFAFSEPTTTDVKDEHHQLEEGILTNNTQRSEGTAIEKGQVQPTVLDSQPRAPPSPSPPAPSRADIEATSRVLSPKWLEAIRLGKAVWTASSSSSSSSSSSFSSSRNVAYKSLVDQALEKTTSLQLTVAIEGITAALNAEIIEIPTIPLGDDRYNGLLSSSDLTNLVRVGSDYGYGVISEKFPWRYYIYPGPVGYVSIEGVFAAVAISSFATEISAQVRDIIIADTGREPSVEGEGESNAACDGNRRHATFLSRRCIPLASEVQNSELNCIRDSEQSSTEAMRKKLLKLLERVSLVRSEASLTEEEFVEWCWTGADSFTDTCGCAGPLVGRTLLSPPDMHKRDQLFLLFDAMILNDGVYAGLPCGMQIRTSIQQPHITLSLAFLFGAIGYFTSGPIQDALSRLSSTSSASSTTSSPDAVIVPSSLSQFSVSPPDLHATSTLPLIDAVIYRPVVVLPLYLRSEEGLVGAIDTLQARSSDLNHGEDNSDNASASFDNMSMFHLDRSVPLLDLSRLVINHHPQQVHHQPLAESETRHASTPMTESGSETTLFRQDVARAGSKLVVGASSVKVFTMTFPFTARGQAIQSKRREAIEFALKACGAPSTAKLPMGLLTEQGAEIVDLVGELIFSPTEAKFNVAPSSPHNGETTPQSSEKQPWLSIFVTAPTIAAALSSRGYNLVLACTASSLLGLFEVFEDPASSIKAVLSAIEGVLDPARALEMSEHLHAAAGLPTPYPLYTSERLPPPPPSQTELTRLFELGKEAFKRGFAPGVTWFKLNADVHTIGAHITHGDVGYTPRQFRAAFQSIFSDVKESRSIGTPRDNFTSAEDAATWPTPIAYALLDSVEYGMVLQDTSLALTVDASRLIIDDARPDDASGHVHPSYRRAADVGGDLSRLRPASTHGAAAPGRVARLKGPVSCGIFIGPISSLPADSPSRHKCFSPEAPLRDAMFANGQNVHSKEAGGIMFDHDKAVVSTVWVDAHLSEANVVLTHVLWSILEWLGPSAPLGPLVAYKPFEYGDAVNKRLKLLQDLLRRASITERLSCAPSLDLSLELPRLPISSPLPLYYGDIRVTGTVSGASVFLVAHPEDPNSKALAGAIEAESWVHISCFGDVRVVADLKRARILQAERIIDEQRSTQLFMFNSLMPGIGGDFTRPIERVPFLRPYLEECENGDYIRSWAATVFFGLRFERIQRIAILANEQNQQNEQHQQRSSLPSSISYHDTDIVVIPSLISLSVTTDHRLEARLGYGDLMMILDAVFTGFLAMPKSEKDRNDAETNGPPPYKLSSFSQFKERQPTPLKSANQLIVDPASASFDMLIVVPELECALVNELTDSPLAVLLCDEVEVRIVSFHVASRSQTLIRLNVEALFYDSSQALYESLLERTSIFAEILTPQPLLVSAQTGPLLLISSSSPTEVVDDTHGQSTWVHSLEDGLHAAVSSSEVHLTCGSESSTDFDAKSLTKPVVLPYHFPRPIINSGSTVISRPGNIVPSLLPADTWVDIRTGSLSLNITASFISSLQSLLSQYSQYVTAAKAREAATNEHARVISHSNLDQHHVDSPSSSNNATSLESDPGHSRGYVYCRNELDIDVSIIVPKPSLAINENAARVGEGKSAIGNVESLSPYIFPRSFCAASEDIAPSLTFHPNTLSGPLWNGVLAAGPVILWSESRKIWESAYALIFENKAKISVLFFNGGKSPAPVPTDPPDGFFSQFPNAYDEPPLWAQRSCSKTIRVSEWSSLAPEPSADHGTMPSFYSFQLSRESSLKSIVFCACSEQDSEVWSAALSKRLRPHESINLSSLTSPAPSLLAAAEAASKPGHVKKGRLQRSLNSPLRRHKTEGRDVRSDSQRLESGDMYRTSINSSMAASSSIDAASQAAASPGRVSPAGTQKGVQTKRPFVTVAIPSVNIEADVPVDVTGYHSLGKGVVASVEYLDSVKTVRLRSNVAIANHTAFPLLLQFERPLDPSYENSSFYAKWRWTEIPATSKRLSHSSSSSSSSIGATTSSMILASRMRLLPNEVCYAPLLAVINNGCVRVTAITHEFAHSVDFESQAVDTLTIDNLSPYGLSQPIQLSELLTPLRLGSSSASTAPLIQSVIEGGDEGGVDDDVGDDAKESDSKTANTSLTPLIDDVLSRTVGQGRLLTCQGDRDFFRCTAHCTKPFVVLDEKDSSPPSSDVESRERDVFTCLINLLPFLRIENLLPFTTRLHIYGNNSQSSAFSSTLRPADAHDISPLTADATTAKFDASLMFSLNPEKNSPSSSPGTSPLHASSSSSSSAASIVASEAFFTTPDTYVALGESSRSTIFDPSGSLVSSEIVFAARPDREALSIRIDKSFPGRDVESFGRSALDAVVRESSPFVSTILNALRHTSEFLSAREAALSSLFSSSSVLKLYVPVWVINRTGLPLEVADAATKKPLVGAFKAIPGPLLVENQLQLFSAPLYNDEKRKRQAAIARVLFEADKPPTNWTEPVSLTHMNLDTTLSMLGDGRFCPPGCVPEVLAVPSRALFKESAEMHRRPKRLDSFSLVLFPAADRPEKITQLLGDWSTDSASEPIRKDLIAGSFVNLSDFPISLRNRIEPVLISTALFEHHEKAIQSSVEVGLSIQQGPGRFCRSAVCSFTPRVIVLNRSGFEVGFKRDEESNEFSSAPSLPCKLQSQSVASADIDTYEANKLGAVTTTTNTTAASVTSDLTNTEPWWAPFHCVNASSSGGKLRLQLRSGPATNHPHGPGLQWMWSEPFPIQNGDAVVKFKRHLDGKNVYPVRVQSLTSPDARPIGCCPADTTQLNVQMQTQHALTSIRILPHACVLKHEKRFANYRIINRSLTSSIYLREYGSGPASSEVVPCFGGLESPSVPFFFEKEFGARKVLVQAQPVGIASLYQYDYGSVGKLVSQGRISQAARKFVDCALSGAEGGVGGGGLSGCRNGDKRWHLTSCDGGGHRGTGSWGSPASMVELSPDDIDARVKINVPMEGFAPRRLMVSITSDEAAGPTKVITVTDDDEGGHVENISGLIRGQYEQVKQEMNIASELRTYIDDWLFEENQRAQRIAVTHAEEQKEDAAVNSDAGEPTHSSFCRLKTAYAEGALISPVYTEEELSQLVAANTVPEDVSSREVLWVQVVSALGLPSADANGKSDPFCIAELTPAGRGEPRERRETKTAMRTLDPVWGESFSFALNSRVAKERLVRSASNANSEYHNKGHSPLHLRISVCDWDQVTKRELLGEVLVDVVSLARDSMVDKWFPVGLTRGAKVRPRGSVRLRILRTKDVMRQKLLAAQRVLSDVEHESKLLLSRLETALSLVAPFTARNSFSHNRNDNMASLEIGETIKVEEEEEEKEKEEDALSVSAKNNKEPLPKLVALLDETKMYKSPEREKTYSQSLYYSMSTALIRQLRYLSSKNNQNIPSLSIHSTADEAARRSIRLPLAFRTMRDDPKRRLVGIQLKVSILEAENLSSVLGPSLAGSRVYFSLTSGLVTRRLSVQPTSLPFIFSRRCPIPSEKLMIACETGLFLDENDVVDLPWKASFSLKTTAKVSDSTFFTMSSPSHANTLSTGSILVAIDNVSLSGVPFDTAINLVASSFVALQTGILESITLHFNTTHLSSSNSINESSLANLIGAAHFGGSVPPPSAPPSELARYNSVNNRKGLLLADASPALSPLDPGFSISLFARSPASSINDDETPMMGSEFVSTGNEPSPAKISPSDVLIAERSYVPVPCPGLVIERWIAMESIPPEQEKESVIKLKSSALLNSGANDVDASPLSPSSNVRFRVLTAVSNAVESGAPNVVNSMRENLLLNSSTLLPREESHQVDETVEVVASSSALISSMNTDTTAPGKLQPKVKIRAEWVPLYAHRSTTSKKVDTPSSSSSINEVELAATRIKARVGGVTASIFDAEPRELLLLTVARVKGDISLFSSSQVVDIDIGRIQLDCQLLYTSHPVILGPASIGYDDLRLAKRHRRIAKARDLKMLEKLDEDEKPLMLGGSSTPPSHYHVTGDNGDSDITNSDDDEEISTVNVHLTTVTHPTITYVTDLTARIQHLTLEADDVLIGAIVELVSSLSSSRCLTGVDENPALIGVHHLLKAQFKSQSEFTTKHGLLEGSDGRQELSACPLLAVCSVGSSAPEGGENRIYISRLHLHPIMIDLTFQISGDMRLLSRIGVLPDVPVLGYAKNAAEAIATSLANIDHAPIRLPLFSREHVFETTNILLATLGSFYGGYALVQIYKILGSSELMGNPMELISGVTRDVSNLLYLPTQDLLATSSMDVATEIAENTLALVRNTSVGIIETLSKSVYTFSKTIKKLKTDHASPLYDSSTYVRLGLGSGGPQNMLQGATMGLNILARELVGGVVGLVYEPVHGAMQRGLVGGVSGFVQAFVNAPVRIVTGVLDGSVVAAKGFTASVMPPPKSSHRIRLPAHIFHDDIIRIYSKREADGSSRLYNLKSGRTHRKEYVYHAYFSSIRQIDSSQPSKDLLSVIRDWDPSIGTHSGGSKHATNAHENSGAATETGGEQENEKDNDVDDDLRVSQSTRLSCVCIAKNVIVKPCAVSSIDDDKSLEALPVFRAVFSDLSNVPGVLQSDDQVSTLISNGGVTPDRIGGGGRSSTLGKKLHIPHAVESLARLDAAKILLVSNKTYNVETQRESDPFVLLVTTLHVYILNARTNVRVLKLNMFHTDESLIGRSTSQRNSPQQLGANNSTLAILLRAHSSSGGGNTAAKGLMRSAAIRVSTLGNVLEISVVAGKMVGKGYALLFKTSDEASIVRRSIIFALNGASFPDKLRAAELEAKTRQEALKKRDREASEIKLAALNESLFANFISRSTLLSRISSIFIIKSGSSSSSTSSAGQSVSNEVFISGSREDFIAATATIAANVGMTNFTVSNLSPIVAICTVVQPLIQSTSTSQGKRCFVTLRPEMELKTFLHSKAKLLLSSSKRKGSLHSHASSPLLLPPSLVLPLTPDELMSAETALSLLLQAAKEEINAHDETRSSTTAALLPRDLVSEPVLSTSRLQKMDEDFIHFLFETPPSGL